MSTRVPNSADTPAPAGRELPGRRGLVVARGGRRGVRTAVRRRAVRIVHAAGPRPTVRLRLTALYAGLFLVCGGALLSVTYGLVVGAVDRPPAVVRHQVTVVDPGPGAAGGTAPGSPVSPRVTVGGAGTDPVADVQRTVDHQRSAMLHTLLVQSGFALGLMALASTLLGWVVAGRILRPLRTITATVREISATSLQRRLRLDGPRDELRDLGDTFDGLLARLEGSFQAQRQFVANASHELRTPLTRQRVLGQVALADPEPTIQSLRAAHERILAAGHRQEQLIEALLTLARSHAGVEVCRPVDLARLVEEAVARRRSLVRERRLTLDRCTGAAVASGHHALVERLVANLLDNAIRYNVPGGQVQVSTGTSGGCAVLTVVNTGPVVPVDAVERLLLPFQRLDSTRPARGRPRGTTSEGLGLGLSIVSAIATAHDATLRVAARPEGGVAVTVTFPSGDETLVKPAAR